MIIVLVDSTVVYNDPLCPRYKRERTKPPLDPAKTPADLLKKKKNHICVLQRSKWPKSLCNSFQSTIKYGFQEMR